MQDDMMSPGKNTSLLTFSLSLLFLLFSTYAEYWFLSCLPERLRYIEYPNSSHDLRRQDEEEAWNAVVNWFEIFLSSPGLT